MKGDCGENEKRVRGLGRVFGEEVGRMVERRKIREARKQRKTTVHNDYEGEEEEGKGEEEEEEKEEEAEEEEEEEKS